MTVFTAGIGAGNKSPDPAKELIKFLTGPEAAGHFKAKGFEPGWRHEPAWKQNGRRRRRLGVRLAIGWGPTNGGSYGHIRCARIFQRSGH